jgi:hypothetical protein
LTEYIEPSEVLGVLAHEVHDLILVRHVGGNAMHAAVESPSGLGETVGASGGDRHAIALRRQHLRDRESDPARPTCHQRATLH